MSKSLYEEALADAKQLLELAEDNAKKAVIEAVTPKIRKLLEKELISENIDEVGSEEDDLLLDLVAEPGSEEVSVVIDPNQAISSPDADGKVTLDLDALASASETSPESNEVPVVSDCGCGEKSEIPAEYDLNAESLKTLLPLVGDDLDESAENILKKIERFAEDLRLFGAAGKLIRESKAYEDKIDQLIERIEDTYLYVTETVSISPERKAIEDKLEEFYKGANRLKESTMGNKNVLKEEDLTIRITNLPDEAGIDPDSLGIDLIVGDDEGEEGEEGLEAGSDEELDLDVPSEDGMEASGEEDVEEMALPMEGLDLSDDTVVEISESMLRAEIARMKKMRMKESSMPVDDFGGGKDEGDPWLDGEVTTSENETVSEAQEEDEKEPVEELQLKRKEDEKGKEDANAHSVKAEGKKKVSTQKVVKEASKLQKEGTENRSSGRVADGTSDVESLRKKLDEQNLFNTKLLATNKLLQNESLSSKQRSAAIEKLEEAKSTREVKLVYESIVKALSGRKQLSESRVLGSSSRPTTSSGATITESAETSRWARLAGLLK